MVERDCARSWLQLEDEDEDHRVRIHEHDEARLLHLWEYSSKPYHRGTVTVCGTFTCSLPSKTSA